jgi:hypothetical protein
MSGRVDLRRAVLDDWDGTNSGWTDIRIGKNQVKLKVFGRETKEAKSLSRVDRIRKALAAFFSVRNRPQVRDKCDSFLLAPLGEEETVDQRELIQNALHSLVNACRVNRVQVEFKHQGKQILLGDALKEDLPR